MITTASTISTPPTLSESDARALVARLGTLRQEIGRVIVGQQATIEEILVTLLAGGHGLLEGVPGLAKTLMVRTLAQAVAADFRRIQFTPDLMPSDILGTEILEEDHGTGKRHFQFNKGPIFANIVLADEINRTPPKTQSALLEAMQEYEVTTAGKTYALERPFFILATQNPLEQAGTYPLPEAQLDRFLLYIRVQYPSEQEELSILERTTSSEHATVKPVLQKADVLTLQALTRSVVFSPDLVAYVNKLVRATRPTETTYDIVRRWVQWGAGPRAGQALILAAKARAILQGRFAVVAADVQRLAAPVLRHRMLLNFAAEAESITTDGVIADLLQAVPIPTAGK